MKIHDVRIPMAKVMTIGLLPSPLKKLYYRLRGYKIGRRIKLRLGSVIDISGSCKIGDETRIGAFSILSGETLRIGKRCKIRALTIIITPHIEISHDVIISETAIIRAQQPFKDSRIFIGDRVHIFPFTIIDPSRPIHIGSETAIGISTYIFTHGAYKDKLAGYPISYGEVYLGKSVWLASRAFIMPGVTLGDDVVVGPGSVVTRSFPEGSFVFGMPARILKRKKELITQYTSEQQFKMLKEILKEFQMYVDYFCQMKTKMISETHLSVKHKSKHNSIFLLESLDSNEQLEAGQIYIVHGKIEPDMQKFMDKLCISWFSYEGHQCSAFLNDVSEVLREYFTRYGVLFERS